MSVYPLSLPNKATYGYVLSAYPKSDYLPSIVCDLQNQFGGNWERVVAAYSLGAVSHATKHLHSILSSTDCVVHTHIVKSDVYTRHSSILFHKISFPEVKQILAQSRFEAHKL